MFQYKLVDAGIRKALFSSLLKQEARLDDSRSPFEPELFCDYPAL